MLAQASTLSQYRACALVHCRVAVDSETFVIHCHAHIVVLELQNFVVSLDQLCPLPDFLQLLGWHVQSQVVGLDG